MRGRASRQGAMWAVAMLSLSLGCQGGLEFSSEGGYGFEDGPQSRADWEGMQSESPIPSDVVVTEDPACSQSMGPGEAPARLMTAHQYHTSVRQLFDGVSLEIPAMSLDDRVGGFSHNVRQLTPGRVDELRLAAETVAPQVVDALPQLSGCGEEPANDCVRGYLRAVVERAWRRPLTGEELERYDALYVLGSSDGGGWEGGARYVIEATLQTPSFVYVYEPVPAAGEVEGLSDFAIAQRMAELLWRGLPDQELWEAAEAGKLQDPEERAAQAQRMMRDDRARYALRAMVKDWFHIDQLRRTAFASDDGNAELVESMIGESEAFIDAVMWEGDGSYSTLLAADYSYIDRRMAAFYGLGEGAVSGDGFERKSIPGRAGLMMQASILAQESGPVHRGIMVRKALLCESIPGPSDPDVVNQIATFEGESERSKATKRMENPGCQGCHLKMEPFGLAFETFGKLGRARTEDPHGNPVSGVAMISMSGDVDGEIANAVELASRLGGSEEVRGCVAKKVFTYAFAREPRREEDACAISVLEEQLEESGGDLRQALITMVQSEAFLYRQGE